MITVHYFFESYIHTGEYKQKKLRWKNEHELKALRIMWGLECFSVINKRYLWYAKLSEQQFVELNEWYNIWLNVPQTRNVAVRPDGLK